MDLYDFVLFSPSFSEKSTNFAIKSYKTIILLRMSNAKSLNYFSVTNIDLREVAGTESHVFSNDEISIILNGRPFDSPFLRVGQVYQIPEPRVLLVVSGEADVHLDLEQYHFEKGTVVVTAPDMIMEFERCSEDAMLCGIVVKEYLHVAESMVVNTKPKESERLLRMMYLLWDIASETPFRSDTVRQMAMAMISDVKYIKQESERMEAAATPSRSQLLFQQFKTLVSQHCDRQRNIPFYAGQLHVSPHHLSTVISRASGHSVMYWINRAVALRAKVLLKTTDLMTYEIAERLNFPNSPAFNNFFKRETGVTPRMYRISDK